MEISVIAIRISLIIFQQKRLFPIVKAELKVKLTDDILTNTTYISAFLCNLKYSNSSVRLSNFFLTKTFEGSIIRIHIVELRVSECTNSIIDSEKR
jgi:hypothetical protein